MTDAKDLFVATQILFEAFHYLQPRMKGGSLAPPQPMNPEALAGCILHGCMARVLREIQAQRARSNADAPSGWIVLPQAAELAE